MRATVLLSISALGLTLGCGKSETVSFTGKLVMSSLPMDWCGSNNPDNIRLDCPFDIGLYVTDDVEKKVLKTVCVKLDADPMRKWGNLPETLNTAMAKVDGIKEGPTVRFEVIGIEPSLGNMCEHDASLAAASFSGKSAPIALMGTDVVHRVDISTKCLKAFTATATCIP